MKRLLALILLVVSPAFAQVLPPVYNPTVEQTYTLTQSPTTSLQNINQTGTPLTLYDDGTTNQPIQLPFDFYYYGNLYESVFISQNGFISFTSNANGCCSGNQLPFLSQDPYYNMNNSIFAMWSDLADFNTPGNPYYQAFADRFTVGWYGVDELGTANKFTFEITLFDNSKIGITYGDFNYAGPTGRLFTSGIQGDTSNEFWQIYYGNNPLPLENQSYLFGTSVTLPPPQFLFWDRVAGEYESFTLTEQVVVRYGAEGVYAYQTLQAGTYDCGNGLFGDPIGGVVKSCEIGSNEPPPPPVVDCVTNPLDPTCIINDLTDFTDEEPAMLADTPTDSTTTDEEPPPEELVAEETIIEESVAEETLLEELLAEENSEDALDEELVADVKELANEEKAEALSDSISKDVLEAALSIAADAVSTATAAGGESAASTSSSDSSSRSTTLIATTSETVTVTTETTVAESSSETTKEESSDSSAVAALDILDTGRQIGQEALAATLTSSESSANDSMTEAQSIAATSSGETQNSSGSIDSTTSTSTMVELAADNSSQTIEQVETEITTVEQAAVAVAEQSIESNMQMQEAPSAVEFTTVEETMEVFANNVNSQVAAEQEELENNIVQQAIAASQTNEEENKMGFAEAEAVTIASDPALANAFNIQPNTASLELLGVLSNKPEEKSDAEIRAEQVVAANKEQQDAINANYMDADQSGIVAAIGSDADVSSYLSQRLTDVPFYKPEDIYKNIVYKDNVRGAYFLEKGNTDTYKKMVEEQYKDE